MTISSVGTQVLKVLACGFVALLGIVVYVIFDEIREMRKWRMK